MTTIEELLEAMYAKYGCTPEQIKHAMSQMTRLTVVPKADSVTSCPPRSAQAERNRKKALRRARRA